MIFRIGYHKPASVIAANALRTIKLSWSVSFVANISRNKKLLVTNNSKECG